MNRWGRSLLVALCVWVANAATASGVSSTINPTDGGAVTAATPAPGGTWDPTGVWTTQVTETVSTVVTEAVSPEVTEAWSTEAAAVSTESPPAATVQPEEAPQACLCDLTPGFCDIGCCCDSVDCGVANLSTVFTGCPQKALSGVCIEKWLMFRANVDSSLVTETDSLFCVRSEDKAAKSFPALPPYPALGASYHFSPPAPTSSSHSRPFYRVDDVIQTSFSNTYVRGLLRQPSPGAAATFCINRNPAKFLRSTSLSCTRMLTPQSCTSDPYLNARSYFSDLSLIKIPFAETTQVSDFLIPVRPLSEWPAPVQLNNSCFNVVEKVEFIIGYTGRGELTYATVNIVLADVDPNQLLLQTHSVQFQLVTSSSSPGGQTPADGLRVGSPVIGRFDGNMATLTTLRSQGGECSGDPSGRAPVLFPYNIITGCTFSSPSRDCSELRSQIYGILQGLATPDEIAMNSGSQLSWTRVVTQECPVDPQETCESGCLLPNSLSIQVLWARQGLLHLPQSYILGAKYIFKCRKFKCPGSSPLVLTTDVTFADTTVFPNPPRGSPQPSWKFPFGFFTRGTAELDGHVVINRSDTEQVTWSLVLFTVMLLTGLEFFTR
ncbi:tectonic-3-like isoform X1 [Hippoglossus hippoglossus]|uniref:tectonic-3-like isoform X1 n=1 Tax=Hippoglossus hippoglossus TaxID=8267 RepID=UPI00148C388C|nr:tectonic-3-like isoform X1 [Hippoglossus hippoglossus]